MRWLLAGVAVLLALACPGGAQAAPFSSHSQLYACCTDSATQEAMFREAKESGAAYIRVDLELETMFSRNEATDWSGPDAVAAPHSRPRPPLDRGAGPDHALRRPGHRLAG